MKFLGQLVFLMLLPSEGISPPPSQSKRGGESEETRARSEQREEKRMKRGFTGETPQTQKSAMLSVHAWQSLLQFAVYRT